MLPVNRLLGTSRLIASENDDYRYRLMLFVLADETRQEANGNDPNPVKGQQAGQRMARLQSLADKLVGRRYFKGDEDDS